MTWWHYLLLVNFYLVLFFGFYALLLRRETFFQLNRVYLVAAALLSFVIPVIQADWVQNLFITQEVQHTIYNMPLNIPYVLVQEQQTGFTLGDVLNYVYISVTMALLIRLIWQLVILRKAIEKPTPSAAYTFFKKISLGENVAQSKVINDHEQVHANQWHSVDVMIIETVMIINWFNPVVYLYRFAIKYIHEFIADSHVIKAGTDKADYAMLLLTQSFDVSSHNLVNQFYNHSLLKQRIVMLQKNRSQRIALAKYGLSAPLFILMMVFSSATVNNSKAVAAITNKTQTALEIPAADVIDGINNNAQIPAENKAEEAKAIVELPFGLYDVQPVEVPEAASPADTGKIVVQVEKQPQFPGGLQAFGRYLGNNIKYPKVDRDNGTSGKVIVSFTVETDGSLSDVKALRGPSQTLMDEAVRVMLKSPKWTPGLKNNQFVRVSYTTPIAFTLETENGAVPETKGFVPTNGTATTSSPQGALQTHEVVIRGYIKRSPDKDSPVFSQVEVKPEFPGGLEAFGKFLGNTIRYPQADREAGRSGKVFVSFIVEKDGSLNDIKAVRGPSETMNEAAVLAMTKSPKWKPGYQNGEKVRVSYTAPIQFTLDSDEDDKPAGDKVMGPYTTPDVKILTTSKGVIPTSPLYVIDGKIADPSVNFTNIPQKEIASINVLKDGTALYGDRGKNGVIIVTTHSGKGITTAPTTTTQGKPITITQRNTKTVGKLDGVSIKKTGYIERVVSGKPATHPLYVVDGKVLKPEIKNGKRVSPLTTIKQEDIATMEVLKDKTATAIYGSAGKDGVIIITTKNKAK